MEDEITSRTWFHLKNSTKNEKPVGLCLSNFAERFRQMHFADEDTIARIGYSKNSFQLHFAP